MKLERSELRSSPDLYQYEPARCAGSLSTGTETEQKVILRRLLTQLVSFASCVTAAFSDLYNTRLCAWLQFAESWLHIESTNNGAISRGSRVQGENPCKWAGGDGGTSAGGTVWLQEQVHSEAVWWYREGSAPC